MADMTAKGRRRAKGPRPDRAGQGKLTWESVREIRRRADRGDYYKDIARDFDISFTNFYDIIGNRIWKEE